MPFLVDGNNLIGLTRGLKLRDDKSQLSIVQRICAYQRRKGGRYTVFFDGESQGGRALRDSKLGGVTIRFSGHGVSADESIKRLLRRAAHPREYTVISSDRQLAIECQHLGSHLMNCTDFNREMEHLRSEPLQRWEKTPSAAEVEEWLKIFGDQ